MKRVLSIIILSAITLCCLGVTIYCLYIRPLLEIKGLDKWYDYVVAFLILTIVYAIISTIMFLAIKGIFKLINWATSKDDLLI